MTDLDDVDIPSDTATAAEDPAGGAGGAAPVVAGPSAAEPDSSSATSQQAVPAGIQSAPSLMGLRRVQSAFADQFALLAFTVLPSALQVRPGAMTPMSGEDFCASLESNSCCAAVAALRPGEADAPRAALVELPAAMAYLVLDVLLGGAVETVYVPRRAMNALERRLLGHFLDQAAKAMQAAWPADAGLNFSLVQPLPEKLEAQPGAMAVMAFELQLGSHVGWMRLAVPAEWCAEDAQPAESAGGEPASRPPGVSTSGPLELSVSLQAPGVDSRELAGVQPGDILVTETDGDGEVTVRVAGIPRYAGKLVAVNGRRAVTITRKLV